MDARIIRFEGRGARVQYRVLMALYRLVFNRWFYGIFCRFLARFFSPTNKVLLDLGGGRAFRVYLDDGYWTRFYLYHRDYEPEVRAVLDAAQGATPLFCDLGANSGLWSVYGSARFDRVIAVEAARETYDRLVENASALPNVETQRAAIFARSGEVMRFVNVHNSHASAHLDLDSPVGAQDSTEEVQTLSVDDAVPEGVAALIKLDVEGAEMAAIDGARRAIRDGAVFIFEDHGSDTRSEVSRHLMGLDDMRVYSIENGLRMVEDADHLRRIKTDRYKGYNFLAGRAGSPVLETIIETFANGGADR
ncbi:MAG: FkbM family methyltransferase [Pseudomonadota bacterium]